MFLCVSPNPAVDKRIRLRALVPGGIHRAQTVESFAGGKSAHVAMVLKALGCEPQWIGLCGGLAGEQVVAGLRSLGVEPHFVSRSGQTRSNLEIIDDSGGVTEIREPGEAVSPEELAQFERACQALFEKGGKSAVVIFSGSLPPSRQDDLYARLITSARNWGCRTLLDSSGDALGAALAVHPDFVKPNREEATAVLNFAVDSKSAAAEAARRLMAMGARSVALSLGSAGMLYAAGEHAPMLFAPAVPLHPRSTVGCGDAAVAGFAHSFGLGLGPSEALRKATACAAANCLAPSPGAVRGEAIQELAAQVQIETFLAAP